MVSLRTAAGLERRGVQRLSHEINVPRLVIGGVQSGCGKTTVTMGLMGAFRGRGLKVQGFKAGPDYIDTGFHTAITGRESRNLDTWMLSPDVNRSLFARASVGADIAILEGLMGLYDGAYPTMETGSTAHLARVIQAPVVLVMTVKGIARSAGAICLGFQHMDPRLNLAGVIFNGVGSDNHYRLLKSAVESSTGLKVFGYVRREEEIKLPERHLGLKTARETAGLEAFFERVTAVVSENLDLDGLWELAQSAPKLSHAVDIFDDFSLNKPVCRIGIALDSAFQFYYADNLALLSAAGAELVGFSPLRDSRLLENLDAVYIGGGYPELHARALSENEGFREDLKWHISQGLPVYAECGGMIYLSQELVDLEGQHFPMVGVVPGRAVMSRHLVALGYREVVARRDLLLLSSGARARGHEFHYAYLEGIENSRLAYVLTERDSGREEGYAVGNVLASWIHLHFASNLEIPRRFVSAAVRYREKRSRVSTETG